MNNKIKRIKKLITLLNKYTYEYYVLDTPSISDKEYDILYDELVQLERETSHIEQNSPTQRVGDVILPEFKKVTHRNHLWSLGKSQTKEGIEKFINDVNKFVKEYNMIHTDKLPKPKFVVCQKYDGLTINCTYNKNGELIQGVTRGTGIVGEEITPQVKTILNLPKTAIEGNDIDVHGEGLMTKKGFYEYNTHLRYKEKPLSNLRNGAAGALRNLNSKETARRRLIAIMYDLSYTNQQFNSYIETLKYMKALGFTIPDYVICDTYDEVNKAIDHIGDIREDLQYAIDGVVISVDDIRTRELMGYTIKFPKWAIAYKFEAEEAITKLIDVEWNTGRTGRVIPTGIIEPIQIGDVVVKRATLNNIDDINKKGLKINADILIRRSNDVIPEVLTVIHESLNRDDIQDIEVPKICPSCGSKLIRDGVHYFCDNTLGCKAQLVKSINHFCEREAMNIVGFNEKSITQLMENNIINNVVDIYNIKNKESEVLRLDRFGKKKFDNLIKSIEKSKRVELSAFIHALGIPQVGKSTANDLAKKYIDISNFIKAKFENLVNLKDIGDITASVIFQWLQNKDNIDMVNELLQYIVVIPYDRKIGTDIKNNILKGIVVYPTGKFQLKKNDLKIKLEQLGAIVSNGYKKSLGYLICGGDTSKSGKVQKAIKDNVKLMTEDQLIQIFKENNII